MPTFRLKFANSKPLNNHTFMTGNSVGKNGQNLVHDVTLVQTLLKLQKAPGTQQPYYQGNIDGRVGPKTLAGIRAFKFQVTNHTNIPQPELLARGNTEMRLLANPVQKHVLVPEGTAAPYLLTKRTEAQVRGTIDKLDWAEPTFRKDLADFAAGVRDETGIVVSARPVSGTQQPQCETDAEIFVAELTWIDPTGREQRVQDGDLNQFKGRDKFMDSLVNFANQLPQQFSVAGTPPEADPQTKPGPLSSAPADQPAPRQCVGREPHEPPRAHFGRPQNRSPARTRCQGRADRVAPWHQSQPNPLRPPVQPAQTGALPGTNQGYLYQHRRR